MCSWVNSWICSIHGLPSAAGSLESSSSSDTSASPSCFPELDFDSLLDHNEGYSPTFEEFLRDITISPLASENIQFSLDEMVGQPSTQLEPSIATVPSTDHDNLTKPTEPQSSTIIQDAWEMTSNTIEPPNTVLVGIPEIKEEQPEFVLEDMISEEIVITSEDHFLNEAYCDEKISPKSICSDIDIDDRNSDQGYESIDSPLSDVDLSLPELFPELM